MGFVDHHIKGRRKTCVQLRPRRVKPTTSLLFPPVPKNSLFTRRARCRRCRRAATKLRLVGTVGVPGSSRSNLLDCRAAGSGLIEVPCVEQRVSLGWRRSCVTTRRRSRLIRKMHMSRLIWLAACSTICKFLFYLVEFLLWNV